EASIAFEEVARRYRTAPEAAEAALQAVGCFGKMKSLTEKGSSFDRNEYERALKYLRENFKANGVAEFLAGKQFQEEQRYEEAAQAYEKVTPDAALLYDEALYSASVCRYLVAQGILKDKKDPKAAFDATMANLKKATDYYQDKSVAVDEARKLKRKHFDA